MEDDFKDLAGAQRRQAIATERTLVVLTTLAFVLAVGDIIPLMGIPGVVIFALFHPLLLLLLPYSDVWCHLHPDTIWPLGFFIAFLWPFSIPIGYAIAFKGCTTLQKSSQTLLWLGIMALWGLLLSFGLCIYGTNVSACMQWPGQPPPACHK